ncbi:MAG: hypothetical protein ACXIUB_04225 [Wenzhouxiangella sp.]
MDQLSFADLEYENKKRKMCREKFLERMDYRDYRPACRVVWEGIGRLC